MLVENRAYFAVPPAVLGRGSFRRLLCSVQLAAYAGGAGSIVFHEQACSLYQVLGAGQVVYSCKIAWLKFLESKAAGLAVFCPVPVLFIAPLPLYN
jgi:hypothetical protein